MFFAWNNSHSDPPYRLKFPERTLIFMNNGIGVSPGIEFGKALVYEVKTVQPSNRMITIDQAPAEKEKVDKAVAQAVAQMEEQLQLIDRQKDATAADLMEIHMELCQDPIFIKKIYHYIEISLNPAPDAVLRTIDEMVAMFSAMEDEYYAARAVDIRDVGMRIAYCLLGIKKVDLSVLPENVIIFSDDLTPSETITMDKKCVLGFVTRQGSKTSHTAILAKALEIPAIVGADISGIHDGDEVIIDGSVGLFLVNPSQKDREIYKERQEKFWENAARLKQLRDLPAVTPDGKEAKLYINISEPKQAALIPEAGATGVGLFRTEFMYMNTAELPNEETQFQSYKEAAIRAKGLPVIIRTLDIGGDKKISYMNIPEEENPFLGFRAIRYCLDNPEIFKTQLRAILRGSAFGCLQIMFPMVCCMSELKRAKQLLEECKKELDAEQIKYDDNIQVGIMVEIPSIAAAADVYAKEVDFFSIGTNDLCQYTLAVDRMNQKIAPLYQPFNPGVLRLIRNTIVEGHKAGIEVGMCGEMASDPTAAALLLGLGLDEFSVSASSVSYVKDMIRSIPYQKAKDLADVVMQMDSGIAIKNYLEEHVYAN